MKSNHEPKLSIKDVPVANERLYEEVARIVKVQKSEVQNMIEFVGKYVAKVIDTGDMEGVMIPYFGKFRPKKRQIQQMKRAQMLRANGADIIFKAIQGKIVVIKNKPTDGNTGTK